MLVEMLPGDRTQVIALVTSTAAVEGIKDQLRARDTEVVVVDQYLPDLYITTDRAGVEYLCIADDFSYVVEDQDYVLH